MSWEDRIQEAAYTSPSGQRMTFSYENVAKEVDKRTAPFEFVNRDGTYIQDRGHTGHRYPFQVIFHGEDYDLDANQFEDMLLERGTGKLEHPVYGTHNVVPFGAIKRRDDLVTAANQTILEVTFWKTLDEAFVISEDDLQTQTLDTVEEFTDAQAKETASKLDVRNSADKAGLLDTLKGAYKSVDSALGDVADFQADVARTFNAIQTSINDGISTLVGTPLTLAFQTIRLIQAPARALASFRERLDGYKNVLKSLLGDAPRVKPSPLPTGLAVTNRTLKNDAITNNLFAKAAVSGSIISAINNTFESAPEAIEAADALVELFTDASTWYENQIEQLAVLQPNLVPSQQSNVSLLDTGEGYQQLQQAVAIATGYLVAISFTLKQERVIVLDRPRTIIDLCAEVYGEIDERLDFAIRTNNISGSEILELPRGFEFRYYK